VVVCDLRDVEESEDDVDTDEGDDDEGDEEGEEDDDEEAVMVDAFCLRPKVG